MVTEYPESGSGDFVVFFSIALMKFADGTRVCGHGAGRQFVVKCFACLAAPGFMIDILSSNLLVKSTVSHSLNSHDICLELPLFNEPSLDKCACSLEWQLLILMNSCWRVSSEVVVDIIASILLANECMTDWAPVSCASSGPTCL